MKKIIFLLAVVFGLTAMQVTKAQTAMTNPNGLAIDTVTNATAEGPVLQVKGYKSSVSMVVLITKISGTVGGTLSWQGSNDGVSYATLTTAETVTDATNTYSYDESPKRYLYYKALITGTGTMSASYSATLYTTNQ